MRTLSIIVIVFGSCAAPPERGSGFREPTAEQRAASFRPYADVKLDTGEMIGDHLLKRTGFVLFGTGAAMHATETGVAIELAGSWRFGTITAIDPRGYFLTAEHCVAGDNFTVAYSTGGKYVVEKPRIVWRGNRDAGGPDLAILAVAKPLESAFVWAKEAAAGVPVISSGQNFDDARTNFLAVCTGGKILRLRRLKGASGMVEIQSTIPAHIGDSGGPVTNLKGELLGITVASYLSSYERVAAAIQPDSEWIKSAIEADWRTNPTASESTTRR